MRRLGFGLQCAICTLLAMGATVDVFASEADEKVFGGAAIQHFKIDIAASEFQKLTKDNRSYVHATLTVGDRVINDVAVRLKGRGSFRPLDQKPSLVVKFNEFTPGQNFHGLTKIMLNNASQDTTLLSEYLATSLFRDAGVPAARVTHARVSLNGRDLGFYVLIEGMNKVFLKQHFADAEGNLYEGYARDIDQKLEQDGGAPSDQSDLRALVAAARLPASERMSRLDAILDVERFHAFLAMSTLIAQHDSYPLNRNNYRIYHDPKSGKFVMIAHGIDGSFNYYELPIRPPTKFILTGALLETDAGPRRYREVLGALFTNVFKLATVTNRTQAATERLLAAALTAQERSEIPVHQASFLRRVAQRHQHVTRLLAEPDPPRLDVNPSQSIALTQWQPSVDSGSASLEKRIVEGKPVLEIKANGISLGAWRSRAILSPGRYRIAAQVQITNLLPGTQPGAYGASLRTFKLYAPPPKRILSDGAWTNLQHSFTVARGEEEVELICDFRSSGGEARFASDSLQLIREQ